MKMEEDKSVEKKEKKPKKGHTSLTKNKNCTADDGALIEVKKEKKKRKKVDVVVIEEDCLDGGVEKKEKKKKKKRNVSESLSDANSSDVKNGNDKEVSKKKKKKKKKIPLAEAENEVETPQSLVKEEEKKQRKKKKETNKSVQAQPENVKIEKEEEEEQAGKDKLPKKAKKAKKGINNTLVISTEETKEQVEVKKKKKSSDEETTEAMDGISVRKKKKKTKTKVAENGVKLETLEGETGEVKEVNKKKSVTMKKKTENGNGVAAPQIIDKNTESKTEKDKPTKSDSVIEKGETELKKKGHKEKRRKASVEVSEVETEPHKKKRKKAKSKGEEEEPLSLKREEAEEQSRETLVTAAEDATKVERQAENPTFETGAKKKKKKKKIKEEVEDQHESPQVDVVFLSEKSGNTDEVTINQERRQALQMEIDRVSQPQKAAKATGFGQWSTAQFDSSDQQQKFLRLMGGFKKGFQPAAGSAGRANMALGKGAQQQLQQGLLGEFERAQSRRMDFSNRGAGLGYAAPSNKKFSIDISACRSVRFDD